MTDILRIALPIYFILYFALAFVIKSVLVAKKIGKNPFVLPRDDSAYGLIGRYFKYTLIGLFIYILVYAFFPNRHIYFLPIDGLHHEWIQYIGGGALIASLIWTLIAQNHMRESWRIGIDTERSTELITDGLFRYSRNPIFLGLIISLIGLLLITPNALTVLFLVLGYVLIQIQIRLEEAFLKEQHGGVYIEYQKNTRRLL